MTTDELEPLVTNTFLKNLLDRNIQKTITSKEKRKILKNLWKVTSFLR